MERTNTVSWSDCERLQRRLHKLSEAMMKYQKKTYQEDKGLGGDSDVIINCIVLAWTKFAHELHP